MIVVILEKDIEDILKPLMVKGEKMCPVWGAEDTHWITSMGRVWCVKKQRFIVRKPNQRGYLQFSVSRLGHSVMHKYVHRSMLQSFQRRGMSTMCVRHLDGDGANNTLGNLAWGTQRSNALDREMHGNTAKGERQGIAILTAKKVRQIRASPLTHRALAKIFGVTYSTIGAIRRRQAWKHVK